MVKVITPVAESYATPLDPAAMFNVAPPLTTLIAAVLVVPASLYV